MTLSAAAAAAIMALAATAPAQAAVTLLVNFSDDANGALESSTGDQFALKGLSGSVTLTAGVAQDVDILDVQQALVASGCCWDDLTYDEFVGHTLTLNGVDGIFFSPWTVYDQEARFSDVGTDIPILYQVAGGTIAVTLNPGTSSASALDGSLGHYTANMLFQTVSATVPEPATWALMLGGMFGAGFALRGARRAARASA